MSEQARVQRTAAELEQRLAQAHGAAGEGGIRGEHADALRDLLHYVGLLREAASGAAARYSFLLVCADGRWDVTELPLPHVPRVGDVVLVDDGAWRISGTQLVWPRPPGKPPREFFVCAAAA